MRAKPNNLKYTDLCIYIDRTVYERDENNNPTSLRELTSLEEETIYNYLYSIIIALATKKRLINGKQNLIDFCYEYASNLFMRLLSPKQDFTLKRGEKKKGKIAPIKSILNYIKGTMGFSAMEFRNRTFKEVIDPEKSGGKEVAEAINEMLEQQVRDSYQKSRDELFIDFFKNFVYYLDKVLDSSFLGSNRLTRNNLRMSVILTTIRIMSLPQKYDNCPNNKRRAMLNDRIGHWEDEAVVWREGQVITKELVLIYLKRTFNYIEFEINNEERREYLSEDMVKEILSTAYPTYGMHQQEEN